MKDNRELLWEAFKITNLPKFANRPKAVERIEGVNSGTAHLEDYQKDQDNLPYGRKADLTFDAPLMTAKDQRWECAMVSDTKVVTFSRDEIFPTLTAARDYNKRGIFRYKDGDVNKVCQIIVTEVDALDVLLTETLKQLNAACHYEVIRSECVLAPNEDGTWSLLVDGATIAGEITVARYDSTKILKGNYILGYMGQIESNEFISGTALGELVGLGDRVINPDPIWLKFMFWGRIIYIPKNPLVNNIAPTLLIDKHLIDDNITVNINSDDYFVRCIKGLGTDAVNEWEQLVYRVHKDDPTNTFWEEFTNEDLTVGHTSTGAMQLGSGSIVYERDAQQRYTYRGFDSLIDTKSVESISAVNPYFGWRPAVIFDGVKAIEFEGSEPVPDALTLLTEYEYVNVGALRVNGVSSSVVNKRDVEITEATPAFTVDPVLFNGFSIMHNRDISLSAESSTARIEFLGYEQLGYRTINVSAEIEGIELIRYQSSAVFPAKLYMV